MQEGPTGGDVRYEVIREIFNSCSNNQMRDVDMSELEIADVDAYMDRFRKGRDVQEERTVAPDGTIVYDLVTDGLRQRVSFTEA
jgi:hypothetical protein